MRTELETLAFLGVEPADPESGPDYPVRKREWLARVYADSPDRKRCSACGEPAFSTRLVPRPGFGPRWVDTCRDLMIAASNFRAGDAPPRPSPASTSP